MILSPSDPPVIVGVPGGDLTFTCLDFSEEPISEIQWLVNGSLFVDFNPNNIIFEFMGSIGAIHFLNMSSEYNNSYIQCRVVQSSGQNYTSTETMVQLQGIYCDHHIYC